MNRSECHARLMTAAILAKHVLRHTLAGPLASPCLVGSSCGGIVARNGQPRCPSGANPFEGFLVLKITRPTGGGAGGQVELYHAEVPSKKMGECYGRDQGI